MEEAPDMNKSIVHFLCITGLLVVACATSGCIALGVGAAAAAGGVEYAEGRSSSTLDAPVERVYNASLSALDAQKLPIKHKDLDGDKADINSEYPGGDEIRIDIEAKSSEISVLHVRVGLTGNRDRESELLEAIRKRA